MILLISKYLIKCNINTELLYLDDIKNRGGIIDFTTICDESNNTDAVIDSYGFRCDVLIKANSDGTKGSHRKLFKSLFGNIFEGYASLQCI
jgi:hypothetical protein